MMYIYGMICVAAVLCLIIYVINVCLYKKTAYYQITGYPYLSVMLDLGRYGEYLTYKCLRSYEKEGAKFLFNCYFPRDNEETTEIDVLMIYKSGIYVFESKNYSGWIFGNEKAKTWTQTLPQGRRSHKEHFLNPIMQNNLHIKWLKNLLQDETIPMHSVIVFSERCTLKKVNIASRNVAVINRDQVYETVLTIDSKATSELTPNKVIELYEKLYPCSQVSEDVRRAHIDSIQARIQQDKEKKDDKKDEEDREVIEDRSDSETNVEMGIGVEEQISCPKCGAPLVMRVAKKGENAGRNFYGCSAFPKCRYIQNVE